ncbi:MAG: TetR/AcrR family transcriptional regulator [Bacteroidia bacterium]|nr:TetR/AcrR family transcriptional regulator [Bacteroidia bacterium]
MKKTKKNILDSAHELFNQIGVAEVSLRAIAANMDISHGNLRYHFPSKGKILEALHQRILEAAMAENRQLIGEKLSLKNFKQSTLRGFSVLYDYRFFMIDLHKIMKENPGLHKTFLEVEKIREKMYEDLIERSIQEGVMREEEYPGEYKDFILRIRIFSDFWISSAGIYDPVPKEELVEKYASLLMSMFYPYLTPEGKLTSGISLGG